jgi:SRSO17 transposase
MSPQDIAKPGRLLGEFLNGFAACFARPAGRQLLLVYVRGLLSGVQRQNAEAIALDQRVAPRTLQRFLESIVWDEEQLRDRCQQIVAAEHAHPDAIGCVDETGTAKSGQHTTGVKRQYNGGQRRFENNRRSGIASRTLIAAARSGKSVTHAAGGKLTRTS